MAWVPFIIDQPFLVEAIPDTPSFRWVDIRLPLTLTEPSAEAPHPDSPRLEFRLETGSDATLIAQSDLLEAGLSPSGPGGGWIPFTSSVGGEVLAQTRDVSLWLHSNRPELADRPYRIDLNGGVLVLPAAEPDSRLLGADALLDGRLRIELDGAGRRFSIWIPEEEDEPASGPQKPPELGGRGIASR